LDDRAVGHRGVLDGHEFIEAAARNDEAAHVLRQMPRETENFPRQRHQPLHPRIVRIEAGGTDALRFDALAVPPLHAARQTVHLGRFESQRLAHVPQGAPGR